MVSSRLVLYQHASISVLQDGFESDHASSNIPIHNHAIKERLLRETTIQPFGPCGTQA